MRFSTIKNCEVFTHDGFIGHVRDLLIEDNSWDVRYIVISMQTKLSIRQALVAPSAILSIDTERRLVTTVLRTKQFLDCPRLDEDQPISREYEQALVNYFGWPIYWLGRAAMISPQHLSRMADEKTNEVFEREGQANLRSASEMMNYKITTSEGIRAGCLNDLIVNRYSWQVDYASTEAISWLPKEGWMFSTERIESIDWADRAISVNLTKALFQKKDVLMVKPLEKPNYGRLTEYSMIELNLLNHAHRLGEV
ncbi:MAG: PRC-barrel domain-containing protein [Planctomycetota bacterium]